MLKRLFITPLCAVSLHARADEGNTANDDELDSVRDLVPDSTARILMGRAYGVFNEWTNLMQRFKVITSLTAAKLSDAGHNVNQLLLTASESGAQAQ